MGLSLLEWENDYLMSRQLAKVLLVKDFSIFIYFLFGITAE